MPDQSEKKLPPEGGQEMPPAPGEGGTERRDPPAEKPEIREPDPDKTEADEQEVKNPDRRAPKPL